jgi:hypothetical protein
MDVGLDTDDAEDALELVLGEGVDLASVENTEVRNSQD